MNKTIYRFTSVMMVFFIAFGNFVNTQAQQTSITRMLIPLYIYPSSDIWANVVNANTYENIDVVINPASGVGTSQSTAYVNGVNQLKSGHVGIYGYVYTGWGSRLSTTVKAEIDNWQLWYNVDGIFLDESSVSPSNLSYYSDLSNYITSKGMKTILNAGTNTDEAYTTVSDLIVIYENIPTQILSVSPWVANYPASKFAALQYEASVEQMRDFVALAKTYNIGYIYVTNDIPPNPWDELPPYLAEEAALLAGQPIPPTFTPTFTPNVTPSITATFPSTITFTLTSTETAVTSTMTPSSTPTLTATITSTLTPSFTPTKPLPTPTLTRTATSSPTATKTPRPTSTKTSTYTPTLTRTATLPASTKTPTPTFTRTATTIPSTPTPATVSTRYTIEIRVAKGADDVEESATGSMYTNSSDLELVYDGNNQVVGIRFVGVNVPKGATITNAYLQFKVDETSSEITNLTIQGEASSNATAFVSTSRNVSTRLRTINTVSWSPSAWLTLGAMGTNQRTPNLTSIVQAIVNQTGWVSGNSLVIIITGTGHRVAEAYEVDPGGAPLLHIEFTH